MCDTCLHRYYCEINIFRSKLLFTYSQQAKIMWTQLSDEQKQTYGEEYFEAALASLDKYTKVVSVLMCTYCSYSFWSVFSFPGKKSMVF